MPVLNPLLNILNITPVLVPPLSWSPEPCLASPLPRVVPLSLTAHLQALGTEPVAASWGRGGWALSSGPASEVPPLPLLSPPQVPGLPVRPVCVQPHCHPRHPGAHLQVCAGPQEQRHSHPDRVSRPDVSAHARCPTAGLVPCLAPQLPQSLGPSWVQARTGTRALLR